MMAKKTKKPVDPSTGPVAQFGYDLRMLRQKAGKSYAAIATGSYHSKSAIWAVDQGDTLPTVDKLKAFVTECGADPERWLAERERIAGQISALKNAQNKPAPRRLGILPPQPTRANTAAEYLDALKELREWSGMTYREIAEITRDYPRSVKASTLCGALKRGTLPSEDLVEGFLQAVDLGADIQSLWLDVRKAIEEGRPGRTAMTWSWGAPPHSSALRAVVTEPPSTMADSAGEAAAVESQQPASYPIFEVRDWELVDGQWHAVRSPQPSRLSAVLRLARAALARRNSVVLTTIVLTIALLVLLLSVFVPTVTGKTIGFAKNVFGLASAALLLAEHGVGHTCLRSQAPVVEPVAEPGVVARAGLGAAGVRDETNAHPLRTLINAAPGAATYGTSNVQTSVRLHQLPCRGDADPAQAGRAVWTGPGEDPPVGQVNHFRVTRRGAFGGVRVDLQVVARTPRVLR
jgi:transcriptional regulator with XRE-family HTH domain